MIITNLYNLIIILMKHIKSHLTWRFSLALDVPFLMINSIAQHWLVERVLHSWVVYASISFDAFDTVIVLMVKWSNALI